MNKNLFYLLMTWDKLYQMSLGEYLLTPKSSKSLISDERNSFSGQFYKGKFISAIYLKLVRNLKIIQICT
jgi:hypothetical protein